MESWPRALVVVVLAAGTVGAQPAAARAQEASADGTLTINGTSVPLTTVYVSTRPGLLDMSRDDIRLVFATAGLTEKDSAGMSALSRLGRSGQAQAVEVILNADGEPMTGFIFAKAFNGMASVSGMHQFERTRFEPSFLAGRLFMDGPRTLGDVTYQYEVRFSTPIPRAMTSEETAAAIASPVGQAASAYVAGVRGGELPPDAKVVAVVERTPASVTATIQGTRNGIILESTVELVLEGGAWRVVK